MQNKDAEHIFWRKLNTLKDIASEYNDVQISMISNIYTNLDATQRVYAICTPN